MSLPDHPDTKAQEALWIEEHRRGPVPPRATYTQIAEDLRLARMQLEEMANIDERYDGASRPWERGVLAPMLDRAADQIEELYAALNSLVRMLDTFRIYPGGKVEMDGMFEVGRSNFAKARRALDRAG